MRRLGLARHLTGLFLLLALALAEAATAPPPQQAAALVSETFDRAVAALRAHRQQLAADPQVAKRLMREVLAPRVDFRLLSRLVLGPHWRAATPAQRERFVAAFGDSLIDTYAVVLSEHIEQIHALIELSDELLVVKPLRPGHDPRRVTVRTELRLGERGIAVDYLLHSRDGRWLVYDVVIEGISFAASRRSEINGLLQSRSLDQLIAQLESGQVRAN